MGAVVGLLSEMEPDSTIDGRFRALSDKFMGWCKRNHETPYITKLSKESIGWGVSTQNYPSAQWHKGNVTTTVLAWIEDELGAMDLSQTPLLQIALECVQALNACMRGVYSSDVWIYNPDATEYAEEGCVFCGDMLLQLPWYIRKGGDYFSFNPKATRCTKCFYSYAFPGSLKGLRN